jgi:hypothetical protein
MPSAAALQVDNASASEMRTQPQAWWQDVLAVVRFDAAGAAPPPTSLPLTEIKLPVLGRSGAATAARRYGLDRLRYKVYVRHAEHQPSIERELRREIGGALRALYLQADICRHDLLVEIEAVGTPEPR